MDYFKNFWNMLRMLFWCFFAMLVIFITGLPSAIFYRTEWWKVVIKGFADLGEECSRILDEDYEEKTVPSEEE